MGSDISLSKAVRANLMSLQNTAEMMNKTQSRLATGNKVNSALDNPSNFFTASALNSRAADMGNLLDSMASGIKAIEAASNGITAITKNIESMQSTLRQARQDKSFDTKSFNVTEDTVITLNGGQFAASTAISLRDSNPGTAAALTSTAAYTGPAADGSGATTTIASGVDLAGSTDVTVDGRTLDLSAAVTIGDVQTAMQAQLDLAAADTYEVRVDGTSIVIENKAVTGAASTSPVVDLGGTAATYASASFTYDSADFSGPITVDGNVVNATGTAAEFAATLSGQLNPDAANPAYRVEVDTDTNLITITSLTAGAGDVELEGGPFGTAGTPPVPGNIASSTFDLDVANAITTGTIDVGGVAVNISGATNADDIRDLIQGQLDTLPTGAAHWTVSHDGSGGFTIAATSATPATETAIAVTGADVSNFADTDGVADDPGTAVPGTVTVTQSSGADGTSQTSANASTDTFTVTYDNKRVDIVIGAGTQEEIAASINTQFKNAGIENVQASFDGGRLNIAATSAEAKVLTITGGDTAAIFGTNAVVKGEAKQSDYNAKNTVDKFVEEINKNYGGELRASNDNGKLRIENLSTQKLEASVDQDGNGPLDPTLVEIDGNRVRANLSKQFNELRDQLDKLSDDASFNGINLLRGDKLTITFNESGTSSISIQAKDRNENVRSINAANLDIANLVAQDLDNDVDIDALLGKLQTALTELRTQASTFGSNLSSVENRQNFTKSMINTLETGAANLTLADTNEEAANLLALQTRQQLSSSALSMASQQDQAVLQLLR